MDDKCHVTRFDKTVIVEGNEETQAITLYVAGMGCVNCANRVHNGLIDHLGILKAEVSHVIGTAEVTYISTKVSVPELIDLVSAAGDHRHTYRVVHSEAGGA